MEKELTYEESKQEKARLEGVITGLALAMELEFEPGYIVRSKEQYENLLLKLYVDPEQHLDDLEEEGSHDR